MAPRRGGPPPVLCWMCDATNGERAKEHIFALSLLKDIGAEAETFAPEHFDQLGRTIDKRGSVRASNFTAGEVCAACNNGWMSDLEVNFRAAVLHAPRTGPITAEQRRIISRWTAKTAVVLNSSQNYRTMIPPRLRHQLRHGDIPLAFSVFVAGFNDAHAQKVNFLQGLMPFVEVDDASSRLLGGSGNSHVWLSRFHGALVQVVDLVFMFLYAPPNSWASPSAPMVQTWPPKLGQHVWDTLPVYRDLMECWMVEGELPSLLAD